MLQRTPQRTFRQAEGVEAMSQIGDSQGVCRRLPVFLLWHGNGFDLLAAEAALSLQCELKDLQVIAVVPFRGQSDRWSKEEQAKYDAILRIVDDVVVLSEQYYNGCLLRRNDYMVNRSSRLIAYFDGNPKGGTFYTVREAKRQGLDIVNLHNSV